VAIARLTMITFYVKLSNNLKFITVIITPFWYTVHYFKLYAFIMRNLLCSTVTVAQDVMEYNTRLKPINISKMHY